MSIKAWIRNRLRRAIGWQEIREAQQEVVASFDKIADEMRSVAERSSQELLDELSGRMLIEMKKGGGAFYLIRLPESIDEDRPGRTANRVAEVLSNAGVNAIVISGTGNISVYEMRE